MGSVTTPSTWPTGKWNWVQLITSRRSYNNTDRGPSHLGDGTTRKLDTFYPYFPPPGTAPADGLVNRDMGDSPSNGVDLRTRIEIHETFETYQMFLPPGIDSRYVPLKKINWHWGGSVSASDNWQLISSPDADADATGTETTDHPKWDANTTEDQEESGA